MSNKFQQIAKAAGGMTALALGLGLLGQVPAQASLIGDQVNLEIELNGEAPDFVLIPGGSQATVEPFSGNLLEGIVSGNFLEGIVSGNFPEGIEFPFFGVAEGDFGEGGLFAIGGINVEDSSFQGGFGFAWNLEFEEEIQPFTWEVTLNDLNWVDYPTGRIVGVDLFGVGFAQGGFLDFAEGFGEGFATFEDFVSVSHTDDSVTLAFSIDPTFAEGFAEGFGGALFEVDLIVEHDAPVATPEPTALGALLALGALGVSKKMKKK
ncbi:MAG: hypothetical protein F6K25_03340 [Okeania sp. SIO2G4]|uniref:hypothetical protein n=1 Tax=unclassified Okeania TaxID=2634635 RepID=UPI0013B85D52|nr:MULTISPECIES: hypothetical protein [unclassified Okeania]NEP04432.1 hypothetical protein [Okeania sp. SIO4D6]NEP39124.1 hypothetical protein [Okeania sp. SIO2H7]NEP70749.1 hypothetical protein [Okeania sp. SIO2G5]NEP95801.1 hypothetical protein [Okeania sp. SIO2F5]NEQ89829.1 hypothetical protein [Okeania sp. SIO2G4]